MLKYNSRRVDKLTLSHKKKLLQSIFNVNYNKGIEEGEDKENSYLTRKKKRTNPFESSSRASSIYKAAQASIIDHSRSNSVVVNIQKKMKKSNYYT